MGPYLGIRIGGRRGGVSIPTPDEDNLLTEDSLVLLTEDNENLIIE
jgi:hypothetical protein